MNALNEARSYCCNVNIRRVGKCNYLCALCGKQQMHYLVFLSEAIEAEEKLENKNHEPSTINNQTRRNRKLAPQ